MCASSRSRPYEHPLRWCARCAAEDDQRHGRAYWHVEHQFPTSDACTHHGVTLFSSRKLHRSWLTVRDVCKEALTIVPAIPVAQLLAHLGHAAFTMDAVDTGNLRCATLIRLRDLGIVMSLQSARHARLVNWFSGTDVAHWCFRSIHGLAQLADGQWIASMLWRRPMNHAVLWILLWAALDWASHREAVLAFEDAAQGRRRTWTGQLTLFPGNNQESAETPQHVRRAFHSSDSYADAMLKLNATRGDIIRWLENDPALRKAWRRRLKDGKQASCEAVIQDALLSNIGIGRASLEKICEAEIRWMREHAPQKLHAMLKSMPARLAKQQMLL